MSRRKRKFEEEIQRMLWKIKMEELNFKNTSAGSVRSLLLEATEFTPQFPASQRRTFNDIVLSVPAQRRSLNDVNKRIVHTMTSYFLQP